MQIKKNKIYIDFDNTLVCSIKCICNLYNEDFKYFPEFKRISWIDMKTWEFKELSLAGRNYILSYFGQPRFFKNVEFMDNAYEIISDLQKEGYNICIVSMGTPQNLLGKSIWIKKHIPYAGFIGIDMGQYKDKSHIDMSDGILIDDEKRYLDSSNAKIKVCFGDEYEWNEEWSGTRCYNWYDIKRYIEKLEGGG